MERVCFVLRVRANRLAEYKEQHTRVWPEMLSALSAAGWHNYSLFLRSDGLLVGYLETPDFNAALQGMKATDVNARWQQSMAPFFESASGAHADDQMKPLEEIFHLD